MTLHELLGNASHGSLMDARDMQRFVQVRDVHGPLGPAGANLLQLHNHDRTARDGFDLFEGTPARVSLCLHRPLLKVQDPPWVRALADGVIDVDPDFPVAASVVIRTAN